MTDEHYYQLQNHLDKRKSLSKYSAFFSYEMGLRNSETCTILVRNFDTNNNTLSVKGKGGRWRILPVNTYQREIILKLSQGKTPDQRLIPIKADSASAGIRRALVKLGLGNFYTKIHKTIQHSLRKNFSTRLYFQNLDKLGPQKARELVMIRLGHSAKRLDLFECYVKL